MLELDFMPICSLNKRPAAAFAEDATEAFRSATLGATTSRTPLLALRAMEPNTSAL